MEVSIIIPTMNRPKLLLRLIHYFDLLEFRGKILIGDSSNAEIFQEAASVLENYRGRLDICHRHLPGRSVAAAVLGMNEYLTTSYVCLAPDDDFIVPRTIAKCIQFLDSHPDYVAAHGLGVLIGSSSGDAWSIESASLYRQPIVEETTGSRRFSGHFKNYSVSLFSVHRTDVWRKIFRNTPECYDYSDRTFGDELLHCGLSAIYGKIKQIDQLYLARQAHNTRYLLPTWFDWITKENWRSSYLFFRDQLAQAISDEDGMPLTQAADIVQLSFSRYLKQRIDAHEAKPSKLRQAARESPFFRSIWHIMRLLGGRIRPGHITLESLLNPTSPYYEDFLPVYNAVTQSC